MQSFLSSPGGGSVQALGLTFMGAALRMGDFLLDISIETPRAQLIPIAGGGGVLNSQINPDFLLRRNLLRGFDCDGQTQPPVPDRILSKAAAFPRGSLQKLALKDPEGFAREAQRLSFSF